MNEKEQVPAQKPQTVVIEQTAKKWKGLRLAGVLVFIIGGVAVLVSPSAITGLILLAGVGLYIYGRFGAWWHHG